MQKPYFYNVLILAFYEQKTKLYSIKKKFRHYLLKSTFLFWLLLAGVLSLTAQTTILPGAVQNKLYLSELTDKNVGVVAHQASLIPNSNTTQHLVDFLLKQNVKIQSVFAPEHGFRGTADAGEKVESQTDPKTGLSIISLYGKNRKPTPLQLKGIDVLVFDLQDVGARFYTYLSTLHYVM